jgi:uncharacterized protein YpmB
MEPQSTAPQQTTQITQDSTPLQPSTSTPTAYPPVTTSPAGNGSSSKKSLKLVAIALVAALVVGGGSAAAYFGLVVPNKPENVLRTALMNSLEQENVSATFNIEGKSGDSPAYKLEGTNKSNQKAKSSEVTAKFTMAGVSVNAEGRYVDSNAYVKVGDLSSVTDIIGAFSPEAATIAESLNTKVADKWFEIDSTLIKESGASCVIDANLKLEKGDYDVLEKAYQKNSFVTVKSNSGDTVGGQAATKYELSVDPKKASNFSNGLNDLPILKKLQSCDKSLAKDAPAVDQELKKQIEDTKPVPLTVWVDKKSKRIVKLASETSITENKETTSGKGEVTFSYNPVTVAKPEGAKPITSLISDLTPLFEDSIKGITDPTSLQ